MARQTPHEGLSAGTTDGARSIIARHGLTPHLEGGWYRETWRAPADADGRAAATAILFLLDAGERSHWHRVDADELWLWHSGTPLMLQIAAADAGPVTETSLGSQLPQALVPAGQWQAAAALEGWALVSCIVVPGFRFDGFTLAPAGWAPGAGAG